MHSCCSISPFLVRQCSNAAFTQANNSDVASADGWLASTRVSLTVKPLSLAANVEEHNREKLIVNLI